jgi:hypothetical protein
MKICIELDEDMQETFKLVKKYYHLIEPKMTDSDILADTLLYFYDIHATTLEGYVEKVSEAILLEGVKDG